ncbi:MAG: hypothetical protein AABY22_05230 [Nanoarchaeota archaeon]
MERQEKPYIKFDAARRIWPGDSPRYTDKVIRFSTGQVIDKIFEMSKEVAEMIKLCDGELNREGVDPMQDYHGTIYLAQQLREIMLQGINRYDYLMHRTRHLRNVLEKAGVTYHFEETEEGDRVVIGHGAERIECPVNMTINVLKGLGKLVENLGENQK